MEARVVQKLLETDWGQACSTSFYCFQCSSPVCTHCCYRHHSTHHGHGPSPAMVGSVYGVPAIRSQDVIGCGYNLNGIQRIKVGGALWIPITQPDENAHYGGWCQQCDRRIKGRSHFCCINCRLMQVHIGIGMAMAQRLVECAATFGQPIHVLDRLCRQCLRVFCSESCPDHLSHQHPDGNAAAALVDPIIIEQTNGWAAIELGQLPAGLAQNIQIVLSEDGRDMCPIQRLRPGCLVTVPGVGLFCCLRCGHLQ